MTELSRAADLIHCSSTAILVTWWCADGRHAEADTHGVWVVPRQARRAAAMQAWAYPGVRKVLLSHHVPTEVTVALTGTAPRLHNATNTATMVSQTRPEHAPFPTANRQPIITHPIPSRRCFMHTSGAGICDAASAPHSQHTQSPRKSRPNLNLETSEHRPGAYRPAIAASSLEPCASEAPWSLRLFLQSVPCRTNLSPKPSPTGIRETPTTAAPAAPAHLPP